MSKNTSPVVDEARKKHLLKLEMGRHYSFLTIWTRRYADMKARTDGQPNKRSNSAGKELLSKEEFTKWCTAKPQFIMFMVIYMDWVASGFNPMLAPSVDRIDNSRGYTVDNMQWLTFAENMEKHDKPIDWM